MSDAARKIIEKHKSKELLATDPYYKGWHKGYWEGIRDCLEIECKEGMNGEDVTVGNDRKIQS